jgi:hypothetical protein
MRLYRRLREWVGRSSDDDRLSASTPSAGAETIAIRDGKTIRTRTLAATPRYRITLHEHVPAARNIVISFGLVDSGLSDKGFGSDFAINSGWDTIYVAQASNTQYQDLDLEVFAGTVTPAIGGRRVVAYGQSIGGYCALYYGGSVNARIIALAPLNSAHPLIGSKRFSHLRWKHRELVAVARGTQEPVVVFDPQLPPDKKFFDELISPAYPNAHVVQLPFAGHTIALALHNSGELKPFLTSIIENGTVPEVRLIEEGSFIWHAERGHYLLKLKDFTAAETQFRKSIEIRMERRAVTGLLRILLGQQRRADVLELLSKMTAEETNYLVNDHMKKRIRTFLGI